jgi:hypothetical protein
MRLTDRAEQTVIATLADVALGERYDHEVTMAYQAGPGGALTPTVVILIVGRSISLDEVIGASPILLTTPSPAADLVATRVRQAVTAIRAERARQTGQAPAGVPLLGVPR